MRSNAILPHGYEIIRTTETAILFRGRHCVTVVPAGTPAGAIAEVALRDAAFQAGVPLRNFHILLERLHGARYAEIATRWGISQQRARQIAVSAAVAIGYPVYTCTVCGNGSRTALFGRPCARCMQTVPPQR